ncbi:MAG: hypothetical protein Q4615_14970 [Paracoccus aminovorans]|nr:hypothetical protein [Paracoccus aminovorans]
MATPIFSAWAAPAISAQNAVAVASFLIMWVFPPPVISVRSSRVERSQNLMRQGNIKPLAEPLFRRIHSDLMTTSRHVPEPRAMRATHLPLAFERQGFPASTLTIALLQHDCNKNCRYVIQQ